MERKGEDRDKTSQKREYKETAMQWLTDIQTVVQPKKELIG